MNKSACCRILKRFFDIVVSALLLLFSLPLLILLALFVAMSSRGSILFSQTRVGQSENPFRLYKFRSMYVDQEQGSLVTHKGDPRVTPTGAILRRWKLDELPQLWNVLIGDMSLVGPRPEVAEYIALYPERERQVICAVRPGITGMSQLAFYNEEELLAQAKDPVRYYKEEILPEKIAVDFQYAQHANLLLDLRILIKTLIRIVQR